MDREQSQEEFHQDFLRTLGRMLMKKYDDDPKEFHIPTLTDEELRTRATADADIHEDARSLCDALKEEKFLRLKEARESWTLLTQARGHVFSTAMKRKGYNSTPDRLCRQIDEHMNVLRKLLEPQKP